MWCVVVEGREYFSTDSPEIISIADLHLTTNIKFDFIYDFGSERVYHLTLVSVTSVDNVDMRYLPRRKLLPFPPRYIKYTSNMDLDLLFPNLSEWIFNEESIMTQVNLFQPGRKLNHGYLKRGNCGVNHMLFLPVKAGNDLGDILHCLDFASTRKFAVNEDGFPNNTWFSVVISPSPVDIRLKSKFSKDYIWLRGGASSLKFLRVTLSSSVTLSHAFLH